MFLAIWYAMFAEEVMGLSGNAMDSFFRLEGLTRDYNEFSGKPPRSVTTLEEQVAGFYSGMAAAEEITMLLLFRDVWYE